MAVSKALTQITWSSSNSVSVSAGGNQTSDAFAFASDSFSGMMQIKADNAGGTPADGDVIDVYLRYTTGDPDAAPDSADEYDSAAHGVHLCTLDTFAEDPAIKTVPIDVSAKGAKLYVVSGAGSNSITVSAQMYESKA